jgi:uncharacterized protein (TIGR00255 family)
LIKTREAEGQAMLAELQSLIATIQFRLDDIRKDIPGTMMDYQKRLSERIRQATADAGVVFEEANLIREIALYSDRTDISEEVVRLQGHLDSVSNLFKKTSDGAGRRLEFLAQEMGREANTLGSKAGSNAISRHAIEIKATLEKFKELILNIE